MLTRTVLSLVELAASRFLSPEPCRQPGSQGPAWL